MSDNAAPSPGVSAWDLLATRAEAKRFLTEAEAAGDRRGVQSFQAKIKQLDKMIARCGFERFAKTP